MLNILLFASLSKFTGVVIVTDGFFESKNTTIIFTAHNFINTCTHHVHLINKQFTEKQIL
jgi:hypothetical protein